VYSASGNWNNDFQNNSASFLRVNGDLAGGTNNPGGTWWFQDNYRHSNASNFWGTQVAWGWEDNANELAQRNVSGGGYSAWVRYLNSGNYNTYAPTKTGGGASGTWNITSNFAGVKTAEIGTSGTNNYTLSDTIPAGVKTIFVIFNNVSGSSTGKTLVRIGSGSFLASGYSCFGNNFSTTAVSGVAETTGFPTKGGEVATDISSGVGILSSVGSNIWSWSIHGTRGAGGGSGCAGAGRVALGGTLDRVQVVLTAGNFDSGTVSLVYM
jgi:hypothetical protein